MTISIPLWMQNAGTVYTAQMWRAQTQSTAGVASPTDWVVSQHAAGANMSVDISVGAGGVTGTETAGQGTYLVSSDAVETVAVSASPSSGQSRIDLVVATIRDSTLSGTDDDMIFQVITGTPSTGTPAPPTLPASSLLLATILVPGLAAAVTTSMITDARVMSSKQGVKFASLNAAHANFGGGTWLPWAGGEITMTAPRYACLIVATLQCYISNNTGQLRLGISTNGGSSYATSPAVYASSTGVLDFNPVHLTYARTSSGSGGIKIQPQGNCSGAGGMGADGGYVTVTVHPT